MHFSIEQRIGAPAAEVIAALTDPRFLARLGELPKVAPPELVDQHRDGDVVVQRVRYRFTGSLSPAVTRIVDPSTLVWIDETTYHLGGRRATFRIVPERGEDRLRCHGTVELIEREGATTRRVDGDVAVRIPLVGRVVERAIVSGLEEHLAAEGELLRAWFEVNP